jgi:exopolyphosphatase / guanosine-5'-triphosphate,3'-diphosphate pyrophosphatase
MFAAVDLGSNSFRLHIGQHEGDVIRVIKTARDPIRLAAGLDDAGNLSVEAQQRAINCLKNFREVLNAFPVHAVRVVATNTIRIAKNAAEFMPALEAAIGHPIEVISGEEEGRLIYMGVAHSISIPGERRLVIDIGGGSTEVILGVGHEISKVESFSIGTVKHSNNYFPDGVITSENFDAAIVAARSIFEDAAPPYQPQHWRNAYGSSGTIRAISDAISKNGLGDGQITLKNLMAIKQHCIQCGHIDKLDLNGIKAERVAMVIGGLAIVIALLQEFHIHVLLPIAAGLRMGVMWDLYLRSTRRDRREQAVHETVQRYHADASRAHRVAEMVRSLYAQLKPSSDLNSRHVFWSGMLHEVGVAISHTSYHKHGAYIVENADIAGFTTREQRFMSKLILSQKGSLKKVMDGLNDPDFAKAVLALRLSVSFMHSRIVLDYEDFNLKMRSKIELEIKQDWVDLHPTVVVWLQKEIAAWAEIGIEFVVKANA